VTYTRVVSLGEGFRQEAGLVITTVDPADIRGLVTTLLFPSCACLDLGTRIGVRPAS